MACSLALPSRRPKALTPQHRQAPLGARLGLCDELQFVGSGGGEQLPQADSRQRREQLLQPSSASR
eukprot:13282929-Alexandrium_andersonii.AAC.1